MTTDMCAPLAAVMDEATITERPRVHVMGADTIELVVRKVSSSKAKWVWVEGFSQAGKSVFATRLAHALGWEAAIYLDHMTREFGKQPDSPRYADHLDQDRIRAVVELGLPVVIEGVCLGDVVEGLRSDAALRIYIARVSRPGTGSLIWHDGIEMQRPREGREDDTWLNLDIIDHHRRSLPHASADFVLLRIED